MNKVYIAAPIFNRSQLNVVRDITMMLVMQEWKYFSPYEASQAIWKGRAPKDCEPEEREQVLRGNIDNLHWADVLLCWVGGTEDGRTDTGVVWELGYFNALQKFNIHTSGNLLQERFTIAYIHPDDKRQNMNLMLAGTIDAVAYGPAQLHRAMELLRAGDTSPQLGPSVVRDQFNPNKYLLHEKEPIS